MRAEHRRLPFSISVDKNAAYPEALSTSQEERVVPKDCKLRRVKYLNNVTSARSTLREEEGASITVLQEFHTAERTLEGIEAVNMMRKGQVKRLAGGDVRGQVKFVETLFGVAALRNAPEELSRSEIIFATHPLRPPKRPEVVLTPL
jgi:hypothetical protein